MAKELSTRCETSTESSAEYAKLLNSYSPTRKKKRLMACCKPTYHMRKLKNKGAIIVLMTSFLSMCLFYYVMGYGLYHYSSFRPIQRQRTVCSLAWSFTVPLVGWLADVILGRYRMIQWSVWIMWMGTVLSTASSVMAQLVTAYQSIDEYMSLVLLLIATVGLGSYQANVIQFGLDQLPDASTDEITSFISWFTWTSISGCIIVAFANMCVPNMFLNTLTRLLVCFCLSIMLVLFLIMKKMLIKEPVTTNPFKLIYGVLKYAVKNKRPRCRSAFTYCEDELPSRIDFGKRKYGGPFSTEQVEDVKTFFRLLFVIILGCTLRGIVAVVDQLANQIYNHANYYNLSQIGKSKEVKILCQFDKSYYQVSPLTLVALLIPLYEFAIYPILRRHFTWVKSHLKFLIGILLQIARVIVLMAFVLEARHSSLEKSGYNDTLQCIFNEEQGASILVINSKLMLVPSILNFLSIAMLGVGGAEFICAQTPYSMRGLMFGATYGILAVFFVIGYGISKLFTSEIISWGKGIISCEFWYLLLSVIFLGFTVSVFTILARWYQKRKREDVLPNEQIFAEKYYTS